MMSVKLDESTKEAIICRLHEAAGICRVCGQRACGHGGSSQLPSMLPTDIVLRAINLGEHFFKEEHIDG